MSAGIVMALAAVLAVNLFTSFGGRDADTRAATRDGQARPGAPGSAGPALALAPQMVVAVPQSDQPTPLPPSFLGLSTEYWSLPGDARHLAAFARVLALLHVPGDGPVILRVGGNSADHTIWTPRPRTMPRWVDELTPAWLHVARTVVHRAGVRLILDLNLITASPSAAARWAQAAQRDLPSRSIVGFEIGNEPDIYSRLFWVTRLSSLGLDASILPRDVTPLDYVRDFGSYARLLERFAPRVPLLGPAIANPSSHAQWVSSLVAGMRAKLGMVSVHRYPYTACSAPDSPNYPTIQRLLSEHASAGMARSIAGVLAVAHRAGLPFRLTEVNSVTCGGLRGVSNAFATALWAPDALFELFRGGVDGVNLHVHTGSINAAFAFDRRGLVARPLLYGLIMFRRALGTDPRLLHVQVRAGRRLHVRVWAVAVAGGGLHVLVIDKGSRAARVALRIPPDGPATVQRLLSPSVAASSGVTLAGQSL
ncbi:MAG TPA: glycosyl hydrolase family 79 C-terminal domain-containing protein, partial [Solirubrobacteraceae bacterium]|nr:glycosyl hydrolase family 79 C-terminal domain-containing protein [Solirubrobacteraceae bacterium]